MSLAVLPVIAFGDYTLDEAVGGLFAFDGGSTDSGISDPELRESVRQHLLSLEAEIEPGTSRTSRLDAWASRFVRDRYLSEPALRDGYSIADAKAFVDWIEDFTGWRL